MGGSMWVHPAEKLMNALPVGKLPPEIADRIVKLAPILDSRVILGPGIGLDCAVIDFGDKYLIVKTDPITFATKNIGWYAVQVNVNDIVTTGASPKWLSASILLPENKTDEHLVNNIVTQLFTACQEMGISFIGGHTEITHNFDRPIISATLLGEVAKEDFISPAMIQSGDDIVQIKELAIETTAILALEFESELSGIINREELEEAKDYLYNPGIGIYSAARSALSFGGVRAMHDPTEGGLAATLWELSIATNKLIQFIPQNILISELSKKICKHFDINPLNTISSGALVAAVDPLKSLGLVNFLNEKGILASIIGKVEDPGSQVYFLSSEGKKVLRRPDRDAIGTVFS